MSGRRSLGTTAERVAKLQAGEDVYGARPPKATLVMQLARYKVESAKRAARIAELQLRLRALARLARIKKDPSLAFAVEKLAPLLNLGKRKVVDL